MDRYYRPLHAVVDSHGGELRLGEGRSGGLRVTIRLPLAPRGPAPAEGTSRAAVPTT